MSWLTAEISWTLHMTLQKGMCLDIMGARHLSPEQLRHIAERFKALAEPSRLDILHALKGGELNVTELLEATGLAQANASKHLQVLYSSGFVQRRKDGVSTYYWLADADVLRLCDLMCGRLEKEVAARKKVFRKG
jgi:ArsR family transcriptional regulator